MLKELLSIFTSDTPLKDISHDFARMLNIVQKMVVAASQNYAGAHDDADVREHLRTQDVEVNRLERSIRKRVVSILSIRKSVDVPYCLLMMSLVKDVERIGDYAKNLTEVTEISGPLPDDPLVNELHVIRMAVETLAKEAASVFERSDKEQATELTRQGRSRAKQCDQLVAKIAASDLPAGTAVKMAVAVRFFKRIESHLLNIISSVIMPLHKIDYFDEDLVNDE